MNFVKHFVAMILEKKSIDKNKNIITQNFKNILKIWKFYLNFRGLLNNEAIYFCKRYFLKTTFRKYFLK